MIAPTNHSPLLYRLAMRGFRYGGAGVSTYLLDLAIVFLLTTMLATPYTIAVAIGFLIGMSTNYFIAYRFIFKGTKRNVFLGYGIFAGLAIGGIAVIVPSVAFLVETFGLNLYVARTMVAALVGTINFLINTFFNFKIV